MRRILIAALAVRGLAAAGVEQLEQSFRHPPDDARILMRWWWFGPAVTKPRLEREMLAMKAGGIGGFEVQPVYPLALDDQSKGLQNLPMMGPEFLEMLRFTAAKAKELGLRMDVTLGSGWPYGGPAISADHAAGRLRIERVKVPPGSRRVAAPPMANGESLIAAFAGTEFRETGGLREGVLLLPPGMEGPLEVTFFLAGRTGQMVKRAAVGAEGFVLDHYDRGAIEQFLKATADPELRALGQPPYAIFCDSLEVFASDWTPDFLSEFRKRRGYDLKPRLPQLAQDGPESAGIRNDWGRTLTELAEERFLAPLKEWALGQKTKFRIQCYGLPPVTIASNRYADLSEGEGPQWKVVRASRWASSANHLFGRPVTSSETWTWLHSPSFGATPLDMKAEADLHFLQGVNQLIGHGWPYNAEGVEYPGWRFYAAAVFNDRNPWWNVMPDVSLYLQRVSFLLRQGEPRNDVALYLPNHDAWAHFRPGRVHMIDDLRDRLGAGIMPAILDAGYNLDLFDDGTVDRLAASHRIVVLPAVERMPVETLRALEAFRKRGGLVVATRRLPSLAPGLLATPGEHREVEEMARRLAVVVEERDLAQTFASHLAPDLKLQNRDGSIGFVHRSYVDTELYFVANTSNRRKTLRAKFRVEGMRPEVWDPLTGKVERARAEADSVLLDLEPYGSRVVVFSRRVLPPPPGEKPVAVVETAGAWEVTFGNGGRRVRMNPLRSWTEDEETRFFSGVAVYETTVRLPTINTGAKVRLDFGEGKAIVEQPLKAGMQAWLDAPVREAAVVFVNGNRAGSVWCPPFVLDVSDLVRAGENRLRVEVANTALNYMAGRRLPDYKLLNLRYGVRFEAQDMDKVQALPSGLFGTVRLLISEVTPGGAPQRD